VQIPPFHPDRFWILGFGFWVEEESARRDSNPKSKIQNLKSKIKSGAVAERRMHFPVEEDDDGSSPFGPANISFRYDALAETDQRRSEEPKSLARYQERPPIPKQEGEPKLWLH
jgi:hypothetical protein